LAFFPATPGWAQKQKVGTGLFTNGEIRGAVHIQGAQKQAGGGAVTLETSEGQFIEEQPLSGQGQFSFTGLQRLSYVVTVAAQGYETYEQTVDLTSGASLVSLNITLRPRNSSSASTTNRPSRTDTAAPKKARQEWEMGVRALRHNRLKQAHAAFENAVKIYPCYARAQTDLALTLFREHNSPQAEAPLRKAIECDRDYVDAYLHLGQLLNAQKRFSESRSVLAEGVRRAPGSWPLLYYLGQADEGLLNYPLAEEEFLRALAFGSGDRAIIHEKLADLYLKQRLYDKAYAQMQAYLEASPNGGYAARIKMVMQQLESKGLVHATSTASSSSSPSVAAKP
jgi:tetratricopeptide (TPR) repeat protein